MARNWTKAQSDAIYGRGGEILVSAAAGSGKTAVLVERVISLLTDDKNPIPADRLLVVTFTNAAANEMRQRISQALDDMMQRDPDNSFLFQQHLLLSKSSICTIHSFCSEVIRDHFQLLDLSPDFRIADETELGLLRSGAMEETLEKYYSSGGEAFTRLAEFFCYKDDRALVDAVLEIYDFIRSHPFPLRWLKEKRELYLRAIETGENPWLPVLWDYFSSMMNYARELCVSALRDLEKDDTVGKSYLPAFQSDLASINAVIQFISQKNWDGLFDFLSVFRFEKLKPLRGTDPLKELLKNKREEIKRLIGDLSQLVISCSDMDGIQQDLEMALPVIQELFDVVEKFYIRLDEKKREKNVLDFSDLELLMMQLLWSESGETYEKSALAESLAEHFDEILVDEYQDTNEVQEAIFTAVSRNQENLFMVGDVKQSIYRFRKAMPEIFMEKSDRFFSYDGVHFPAKIRLDKNFRSRPEVTAAVNYFFEMLMSRELGEVDYSEERLVAGADYPKSSQMQAELHVIDQQGQAYEEDRVTLEARHIAYEIRRMIAQGVMVQDKGKLRRCEYRDFCILVRSVKDKAGRYVEELKKQGIHVWSDTTLGYFDSMEIALILNLLRVLDNPLQDIALLSVLMSPVFGFTADDMAEIRLRDRTVPLYLALGEAAKLGNCKAAEFLETTDVLRRFSVTAKISRLIQKIYDTTDFIAVVASTDSGEQRRANLRLLLEYANTYERAGYQGLSGFIGYIDRTIERGQDFESANVLSEQSNAVKVMSIHKSKGLEYPICFLADLSKPFNMMDTYGNLLLHPELGIGLKLRDPERLKKYATLPYLAESVLIKQGILSEELRVLYVAMTRAREKLIFVVSEKNLDSSLRSLSMKLTGKTLSPFLLKNLGSYAQWLLAAALFHPDMGELRYRAGREGEGNVASDSSELRLRLFPPITDEQSEELVVEKTGKADPQLMRQIQGMIDGYSYPYLAQTKLPAKLSVTQIMQETADKHPVSLLRPSFVQKDGFSAMEKGTIFHKFLQYCDFEHLRRSPEEEMVRMADSGRISREEYSVLDIERVKKFANSQLLSRILKAVEVYREFRFISEVEADIVFEGQPNMPHDTIQVQGMADCVLVETEGLVIIDYKTDYIKQINELLDKYHRQLELYARALSESFQQPVKACFLYSITLAEAVEIKLKN